MSCKIDKQTACLEWLAANGVGYDLVEHEAVFTIDEMDKLDLGARGIIVKNLFLRDDKGKRHFLVCERFDKRADLRALGETLGVKLSFASPERLQKFLGLEKGAVTPLGLMNDKGAAVEVLLDADLDCGERLGVHPCVNTASAFISYTDLVRLIEGNGNSLTGIKL